ncbi:MAG: carboxylating nicotinate-nucleotide diphosphorylase [Arenicellales bacterium]|jgi:nicotinate-nucleotide pyrophosphorylase (carboxylating)|nr:carboxylating nicotinate-nucleotide diphosphorylase [Arenicellales bacterium]
MKKLPPRHLIAEQVRQALAEDIGTGDLTATLVPDNDTTRATLISREPAVVCGVAWVQEVFDQLDPDISIDWLSHDGDDVINEQAWCTIQGSSRGILTGERTALNFLQLLSGTATATKRMVDQLKGTTAQLLDTRKTVPGLRLAQKYAVCCGGGTNHRLGLYDGILVKENHIRAAGSVTQAMAAALAHSNDVSLIEVEVESVAELSEALTAGAQRLLLDNFSLAQLRRAVQINAGQAQLEASGNVTAKTIREIALTGVNFVSSGAMTKNIHAVDLSLQFEESPAN